MDEALRQSGALSVAVEEVEASVAANAQIQTQLRSRELGFPGLAGWAPDATTADANAVLRTVRRQLSAAEESDESEGDPPLLRIKEQMLLALLQQRKRQKREREASPTPVPQSAETPLERAVRMGEASPFIPAPAAPPAAPRKSIMQHKRSGGGAGAGSGGNPDAETEADRARRVKPRRARGAPRESSSGAPKRARKPKRPRPLPTTGEYWETDLSRDDGDDDLYAQRIDLWQQQAAADHVRVGPERADEEDEEFAPVQDLALDGGFVLPGYAASRLFGYQRVGLTWLCQLHASGTGGIIGDEMGLGKTVQVACLLGALHHSNALRSALVVVPATVLHQWVLELHRWCPPLRVRLLHHTSTAFEAPRATVSRVAAEGGVLVTTYASVRQHHELLLPVPWTYAILDEGQAIRNPDAEITLLCKRLQTVHRLILTGTPISNHLRELWSLFDFCFPGRLGTLPTFETEFSAPIRQGGYSNASPMQVRMAYKCALVLKDLIGPYLLRRLKKDVQEVARLPPKTEHVLFCRLSDAQRDAYVSYLDSDEVARVVSRETHAFRAINQLRKICNHADLEYTFGSGSTTGQQQGYGHWERSGKLALLRNVLPLLHEQGHRVLVFSQTRQMLDILVGFVAGLGLSHLRLDGNTPVGQRQALIQRFNADDSVFCMLLTTRTGGLGVSLTGADRVIIFDPDWNPSTDLQARERAWRLGQERQVAVYRLITSGTIEEKVYHRQVHKQLLSDKVLTDAKQRRVFRATDLRDLFTLHEPELDDGTAGGNTETNTLLGEGAVRRPSAEEEQAGGSVLEAVFDAGVAGVFSHDTVENGGTAAAQHELLDREAAAVARDAAEALRDSRRAVRRTAAAFAPTWTGEHGEAGAPAALGRHVDAEAVQTPMAFGAGAGSGSGGDAAHLAASAQSTRAAMGVLSSQDLLARMRQRQEPARAEAQAAVERQTGDEARANEQLAERIRSFLRSNRDTSSDALLAALRPAAADMLLFKHALQAMARLSGGKWRLRGDFDY